MDESLNFAKFVSQKVNKIRWQPKSNQLLSSSTEFATGSWDNDVNHVCVWALESRRSGDEQEAEPWSLDVQLEVEPRLLCQVQHPGDVTELAYLQNNQMLVSSSNGSVHLYKHHPNSQTLSVSHSWAGLHRHVTGRACACVSLAVRGNDTAVTVGEDGRMCFLNLEQRKPLRVIEKADSCTMQAVTFLKQAEVAAVNSTGQLKLWDTRQAGDQPTRIFIPTGECVTLQCVDKHPTQSHVVVTGGQDGALTVWDTRQDRFPVTVLNAHSGPMWEVRFHPNEPDHLITCSDDGSVWHWNAAPSRITSQAHRHSSHADYSLLGNSSMDRPGVTSQSAWLGSEAAKHRTDVTDLLPGNRMPVNSIDVCGDTLICGTDGEQVITICNLRV